MKARFTRLLWFSFVGWLGLAQPVLASLPPALAPPAAPTGLGGTVVSATQIDVSWNAVAGADTYELDRATDAGFTQNLTTVTGLTNPSSSATGLDPNTTYHFRVRAVNVDGPSPNSGAIDRLTRPGPPTLGGFTNVQAASMTVNWTAPGGPGAITGYELDRATDAGFTQNFSTSTLGNVTSTPVGGLTQNTTYYFRVRATNASGASVNSGSASQATPQLPPAAPVLSASPSGSSQINLSWAPYSSNADNFDVQRATSSGGPYTTIATNLSSGDTDYPATGLTDGTTYYFQVIAKNGAGNTTSNEASATTPLNPPTLNSATAVSSSQINLTWTDNSGSETGYDLDRATDVGFTQNLVTTSLGTGTSTSVTGLAENTQYFFRLRAKNGTGSSGNSNTVSATTILNPPLAPTGLQATNVTYQDLDLTWNDNAVNEASYAVDRATNADFTANLVTVSQPANQTTFEVTGLNGSTQYFFRVRAINASGEAASNVIDVTTLPDPPGPPQNFAASAIETTTLTLTWNAPGSGGPVGNYELVLPVPPGTVTQTGTSYNVTNLSAGTNYEFKVRAQNAGGISSQVSVTALTKPGKPTGLGVSVPGAPTGITQLNLSWSSPGGVVSGYDVDRAASSGGPWTTIATDVGGTTYSALGLSANTQYFFRVRAKNTTGSSVDSDAASNTTLPNPPAAPTNLTITTPVTSTSQIAMTWADNADNEVSYEVQRSENGGGWSTIATGLAANTSGYTATGLNANTPYAFRVRAVNPGGPSGYSNEPPALTLPAAPGTPSATVPGPPTGITQINLAWSAPGGAGTLTGYKLDYATNAEFSPVITVDVPGPSHSLSGLTANTQYFFRVRAVNASGESASSGSANATTLPTPPTAPSGLGASASASSPNQIDLTWTDNATNETGYEVERSTNDNSNFTKIADLGVDAKSYPSTGLSSNTTYFYRVRAVNPGGPSGYSNEASALTIPDAPGSLSVSVPAPPDGITKLSLTWSAPLGTLTGYDLEYATNAGFTGSTVTPVPVGTSFTLAGLTQNTTYHLRLRAKNATGPSPNSNAVSATTLPNPPGVPAFQATTGVSANGFTINWSAPGGPLTGYVLDVATDNGFGTIVQSFTPGSGATSQPVGSLNANTTYYFRIKAVNTGGESQFSTPASQLTLPAAPDGFVIQGTPTVSAITLAWTALGSAVTEYELRYSTNPDPSGGTAVTVANNGSPYTVTDRAANTRYYFQLRAKNATGLSAPTTTIDALTLPAQPQNFAIQSGSVQPTQVTVQWDGTSPNPDNYTLTYSANSDLSGASSLTPGGGATNQVVSGLTPNTTYYFRLVANNATGASQATAIINQLTLPAAPTGLTVLNVTTTGLRLTWAAPPSNPASYELSISPNPGVTLPIAIGGGDTGYDVTGLSQNTTYAFELRAKNVAGLSAPATVQQLTKPSPPSGLAVQGGSVTDAGLRLTWTPPGGGLEKYELYYSTATNAEGGTVLDVDGGTDNFSVSGLSSNTTYYFKLRAKNATDFSGFSNIVQQLTFPAAPAGFAVQTGSVTTSGLTLQWTALGGLDYELKYSTNADGEGGSVVNIPAPAAGPATQVVAGLAQNTTYYFKLRAKNATGLSAPASVSQLTLPAAPTALNATNPAANSVTINWTPPGGSLNGYNLDYSTDNTFGSGVTTVNPSGGENNFNVGGLTANTQYYFRLRAVNGTGASAYSATLPVLTRPAAPTNLVKLYANQTTIVVQWVPPAGTLTGYQLQVATDAGFASVVQTPTPAGGANGFTVTGLSQNTTYYLRVRAKNTGDETGYGEYSNVITVATPPNPPAAPVFQAATGLTQTSMFINWTPVTGGPVSGYTLEYSRFANFNPVDSIVINDGTKGQQQITGLTSKTIYYVRIRAFNVGGHSPYSTVQQVQTLPDPPTQPTDFKVVPPLAQNSVNLSWVPPATADQTGYELLYSTDPTFSGTTPSVRIAGNQTTYTLTGLTANTTYYLRLRAINDGGSSIPADISFTTLPNPPAAPTNLSASLITQTGFTLGWAAPAGPITGYTVQVATDQAFTNVVVTATPGAGDVSVLITGLTQNTNYFVRIRADNTGGQGAFSSPAFPVSTLPNAPATPTNFTASAPTASGVTLSWTAPAGPIGNYTLEYSTDNTFATGVTTLNPAGSASSQPITGLSSNTTYYFRLKAVNAGGDSPFVSLANPVLTLPGPPTNLAVADGTLTQTGFTLTWAAPGGTLTGYQLRYSTNADPSGAAPVAVGAGQTSFNVTGLSPFTTYYFQLTALNSSGSSLASVVLPVQTLPNAPAPPTNLSASNPGTNGLTVNWTAPAPPIDSYTLEYSTDQSFGSGVTTLNPAGSATSQPITGLSSNTTYYFRLRATNGGGPSPNSAVLPFTTLPDAPTGLAASVPNPPTGTTQIDLSWTAPGGTLTGYDLQYATDAGFTQNVTNVPVVGTPTSTSVGGLAANTQYFFRLRAVGGGGPSAYVVTNATTLPNAPAAPTNLNVAPNTLAQTGFTLTWAAPGGPISGYTLEYSTDQSFGSGVTTLNPGGGTTSQPISGLTQNTTYYFRLRATNAGGTSPNSAVLPVTTLPDAPATPGNFSASAVSASQINLSWNNPGTQTALDLQYSTGANFGANVQTVSVGANDTGASVNGLAENTTYYFRLRAQNGGGFSGYATTQATTLLNPPAAPSNLSASATSPNSIRLSWADNSGTEGGFSIEQDQGGGNFVQIAQVGPNTTGFTVNGLNENSGYTFRVRAFNASGNSGYSNTASAQTPFSLPAAPGNLQAGTVTQTSVPLTWADNAGNETGYEVEISTDGTNFNRIAQLGANATSYTANGLNAATSYSFRVRAVNPAGSSGYSNTVRANTLPFPPQAPSVLAATPASQTTINLTWTDNATNEDRFELERSTDGVNFSGIATPAANSTQAQATGLTANTLYYFRLRAVNAGGASAYSNVAQATTLPNAPVAPSNLAARDTTQTSVVLTWTDNANDETGVEVFQADSLTGAFRRVAQLPANTTSYLVPTLLVNKLYRFRVRMVNGGGGGEFSPEISVQTLPFPPEAPTLVQAQAIGQTSIRLRWRNTTGTLNATRVEQSLDGKTFTVVQTLRAPTDGTNVENLQMNTIYFFRLQAVNRGGVSPYSVVVTDTTLSTVPTAPLNLRAETLRARSLRLRWDDRSDNEARFEVEQWRNNRFERIANTLPNVDSLFISGLTDQTEYRFRVRASNRTGASAYTNELTVTTPLGPPDAPTNLQFTSLRQTNQLGLKWIIPNRRLADSIDVEQSIDGAAYRRIQSLPSSADSTLVVGLQLGSRYAFRIRTLNRAGASGYSNVVERAVVATGLEPQANARVRIQPNPVEAEVLVEAEDEKNRLRTVEVLTTQGQRVFRWEAIGPARGRTLSLGDLPAGVYILSAETDHGVTRQKLLKR